MSLETLVWGVLGIGCVLSLAFAAHHLQGQSDPDSRPGKLPDRGPLVCPFCDHMVAEDVAYVGQQSTCPNCHAAIRAPHKDGPMADPEVQQHLGQMGLGCLSLIFGLLMWWWVSSL